MRKLVTNLYNQSQDWYCTIEQEMQIETSQIIIASNVGKCVSNVSIKYDQEMER